MPHATTSDSPATATQDIMADTAPPNGDTQATNDDITMAEPDALPGATNGDTAATDNGNGEEETKKSEVKLEDLFADVDSDDEFPSSRPQATPQSSSPGVAPSSPPMFAALPFPSFPSALPRAGSP